MKRLLLEFIVFTALLACIAFGLNSLVDRNQPSERPPRMKYPNFDGSEAVERNGHANVWGGWYKINKPTRGFGGDFSFRSIFVYHPQYVNFDLFDGAWVDQLRLSGWSLFPEHDEIPCAELTTLSAVEELYEYKTRGPKRGNGVADLNCEEIRTAVVSPEQLSKLLELKHLESLRLNLSLDSYGAEYLSVLNQIAEKFQLTNLSLGPFTTVDLCDAPAIASLSSIGYTMSEKLSQHEWFLLESIGPRDSDKFPPIWLKPPHAERPDLWSVHVRGEAGSKQYREIIHNNCN